MADMMNTNIRTGKDEGEGASVHDTHSKTIHTLTTHL